MRHSKKPSIGCLEREADIGQEADSEQASDDSRNGCRLLGEPALDLQVDTSQILSQC